MSASSNLTNEFPPAVDASKVGTYPARTLSGGGYFYDDVLEYRVWVYTDQDGEYFCPFADYANALLFSNKTEGAKEPYVLVLQKEYVDEPEDGVFIKVSTERIAEWRPDWLMNSKREENNIDQFIAEQSRSDR